MNILEQKLRQLIREELTRRGPRPLNEMMGMGPYETPEDLHPEWDASTVDAQQMPTTDSVAITDLDDDEFAFLTLIHEDGYAASIGAYGDETPRLEATLEAAGLIKKDPQTGSFTVTPEGMRVLEDNTW